MTPDQIAALRQEYATKSQELDTLLNAAERPKDFMTKAESLDGACTKLLGDINAAEAENAKVEAMRLRSKSHQAHLADKRPHTLFSGQGGDGSQLAVKGFEAAGHNSYSLDFSNPGSIARLIEESGPGTFGQKAWDAISSVEYRRDFRQFLRKGERIVDGSKALMEGIDDQGGIFAPAEMIQRIIGREPAPTQLRSLVQTLPVGKDVVELPRLQYSADDRYTTAFRATWTGEGPSDGSAHAIDDRKIFGSIQIPVHTAMLSGVLSKNLLEDASFAIQPWLEAKLSEAVELLYEDMILNGNGINQPAGMLLGAAVGNDGTHVQYPRVLKTGSAGAITADSLDDIQIALAPQYENERTRWIMHKDTYGAIRKLKDGQNRPLFTQGAGDFGLVTGRGRVLLSDPITFSAFAPALANGSFPVIYGDPYGYFLAQRIGLSIQTLYETRAKNNQVELVGRVRFGGKVVEPFRLKILAAAA